MIWYILVIIITLVGLIWSLVWAWREAGPIIGIILGLLVGFLCFLASGALAIGADKVFYTPSPEGHQIVETVELQALNDSTQISGSGSFINVSIGENDVYVYMTRNEDGTYSKNTLENEVVKIKETNDETPRLEKYCCTAENEWLSMYEDIYYCFVVPEGTVVNTFDVDLE